MPRLSPAGISGLKAGEDVKDVGYAELHCISNFTFLRGASHPEELVEQAARLGYQALALTDECSLGGIVRAHQAAKQHALQLIIGSTLTCVDGLRLVLLARNRTGYGQLCALITQARRAAPKGSYQLERASLQTITDCLALWLPDDIPDEQQARFLKNWFQGRLWIAVQQLLAPGDQARLERLVQCGQTLGIPLVAASEVHMHLPERQQLQDVLTATRLGVTLRDAGLALYPNGERHLRPLPRLAALFGPELCRETLTVAAQCHFSLDELRYEYPREWLPGGVTPAGHLRALTDEGARRRWPEGVPPRIQELIGRELALIAELHYEAYFLTVHDIVRFARGRGILCQGRGSAANSAVCYCLGITEVDPMRIEVLFERFISKERNEPPDIDVDFEHERREEVIQYLFDRYGRDRAAMTASVVTYRLRSAIRDVGRALGLSPPQLARIAKAVSWWDGVDDLPRRLQQAGLRLDQPPLAHLMGLVTTLVGFPRHRSQHVGGMVLSHARLDEMVPIENTAMPERTVLQWDKNDLDALGLLKVDCLALGMLSAIHRCFDLIAGIRGRPFGFQEIPPEDADVYRMIQQADTVGVFQIESRAQMAMLPRLKPETFYDLVVQIAIVRPGPIQGDMVHPYLRRRQGLEPVVYPGPEVRSVLARTLGIPIFQEQVIKLAMVAAGFSPGEADQLRRSMAAWARTGMMEHFRERLINGMRERGYAQSYAEQIFRQIEGFGDYGFPESHAASFALLAYVAAWLKHHYPEVYVCALLNSQPMGFYAPAQLIQDARRHGVEFLPVDVRYSDREATLERVAGRPGVRLGLGSVKGLSRSACDQIMRHRAQGGRWEEVPLTASDRRCLALAGAFEGSFGHRRRAHWHLQAPRALPLFAQIPSPEGIPLLKRPDQAEQVQMDYQQTGLSLRGHPISAERARLLRVGAVTVAALEGYGNGQAARIAGLVVLRQRPATASGVIFVTLEDETGSANVVVWGRVAERDRRVLLQGRFLVAGEVQREGLVMHVVARRLIAWDTLDRIAARTAVPPWRPAARRHQP